MRASAALCEEPAEHRETVPYPASAPPVIGSKSGAEQGWLQSPQHRSQGLTPLLGFPFLRQMLHSHR